MIPLTYHARERRLERCPFAVDPHHGLKIGKSLARRIGIASRQKSAGAKARVRKVSRQMRRDKQRPALAPVHDGKTHYYLTPTACWLVSGKVAVTVVPITPEQFASVVVYLAMGVWP